MKFLHTSDLHIGLRLCEYSLLDDSAHILSEIADIASRENCSSVVVAGDIYDRSNPSAEAIAIFDRFVTDLSSRGISLIAVYGNHDSPERIGYLSNLLSSSGVHFSPVFNGKCDPVTLNDEFGEINFYLLPFIRPINVRAFFDDCTEDSFDGALSFFTEKMVVDTSKRNVMVTHQFVSDDKNSPIPDEAGGCSAVTSSAFKKFDYAALGHIHRAYSPAVSVRYCGSPMKCSFSEVGNKNTVDIVEIKEKGNISVNRVPLHPLHEMREMRGSYNEIMSREVRESANTDDYLRIILTDEDDIPDAAAKLRTVYKNLMRLSYDNKRTREIRVLDCAENECGERSFTPEDIFADLYELQNNKEADESIMKAVCEIFDKVREEI